MVIPKSATREWSQWQRRIMDASPGNRMEQLLADFAERYAAVSEATAQMDALSVTAQSRDGVVEASVGVNGRALTVRFISKRCRDMTYSELAEDVLDALTTARAEAAIRISTLRRDAGSWLSGRMAPTLESNTGIWGASSAPRQLDMIRSSNAPGSSGPGATEDLLEVDGAGGPGGSRWGRLRFRRRRTKHRQRHKARITRGTGHHNGMPEDEVGPSEPAVGKRSPRTALGFWVRSAARGAVRRRHRAR